MAGVKGRSGRKRKPKAELLAAGSKYAGRQVDYKISQGLIIPDNNKQWMKHQENFWKIYGGALIQAKIVKTTDSPAFEALSEAFCLWKICSEALKDGDVLKNLLTEIPSKRGTFKTISELSKLAKMHREEFVKLSREFGMTPASRASLDVDTKDPSNELFDGEEKLT